MTESATTTRPDTSDMRGVIPYIAYGGRANEAAKIYAKAPAATNFGGMANPEDSTRLMHAQFGINSGSLMMTAHGGEEPRSYAAHHRGWTHGRSCSPAPAKATRDYGKPGVA